MNIARGDIAVGETDPYKVGSKSGIAYSPTELKAIENAYAGIYDPALNDVFSRLKDRRAEDAKALKREEKLEDRKYDKEMIKFRTNESIRAWRATTGTTKKDGEDEFNFSDTQIGDGATNAAMEIDDFKELDPDVKNFYINMPKLKDNLDNNIPIAEIFGNDMKRVESGELSKTDMVDLIYGTPLPPAVQHYFVGQIPEATEEEKEGWFSRIWGWGMEQLGK